MKRTARALVAVLLTTGLGLVGGGPAPVLWHKTTTVNGNAGCCLDAR